MSLDKLARQMEALPRELSKVLPQMASKNLTVFENKIEEHLTAGPGPSENLHVRTGTWRANISSWAKREGDEVVAYFGTRRALPYPKAHEFGTPPRRIQAVNKKALAWPVGSLAFRSGARAGQLVPTSATATSAQLFKKGVPMAVAKYVNHPGLRARRPYGRAIEAQDVQEKFLNLMAEDIASKAEELLSK